jgi:phospholipid/cholesterol/gamma-HCH transport system substrate-binding protein
MKTELKVGIFAILVILILSYMTFKVSGLGVAWKKGYVLYVIFDNISGLDEKSRVKVAGVDAGVVSSVDLEKGKAKLSLLMKPDVTIYENAKASLRMSGLLGDKYLALSAGTTDKKALKDGDWVRDTESAADIDALANELSSAASYISDLAEGLQDLLGHPEKEALRESFHNLMTITRNLNEILEEDKETIRESIHNLMTITRNINEILEEDREPLRNILAQLEEFSGMLNEKGPGMIDDVSSAARALREVIEENRYALKDSIENIEKASESVSSISQKIDAGEGSLGKLLTEDELYDSFSKVADGASKSFEVVDRLKTFMDFRTEYLTSEGDWKGYFDLTLQTRDDLSYIFGVVSDPIANTEETLTVINDKTFKTVKAERDVEFSIQLAKRFEDFVVRIGMIENTFGLGADYFFHDEKGKVSLNAWDFSADEFKADNAHVKIGLDYKIFKNLFVSSGIDNLMNSDRRGIFIGGGLKFEEEDLKYLLSLSPL